MLFYGRKAQRNLWADVEKRAEAALLAGLWRDEDARSQCDSVLPLGWQATPNLDTLLLRGTPSSGSIDLDAVGGLIEAVVVRYGAPHLLPSTIARRRADSPGDVGWCFSLRALSSYMAAMAVPICALGQAVASEDSCKPPSTDL